MCRPLLTITVREALRLHYWEEVFAGEDKRSEAASEAGGEVQDRGLPATAAWASIRAAKCICHACSGSPQEFHSFGETRRCTDEGSMPAGDPELFRNSENCLAEGDVFLSAGHFPPAFASEPRLFANGAERESTLSVCSAV